MNEMVEIFKRWIVETGRWGLRRWRKAISTSRYGQARVGSRNRRYERSMKWLAQHLLICRWRRLSVIIRKRGRVQEH